MQYVLIFFLFLSACSTKPHTPVVHIDPAFQGLVTEFVAESQRQGRAISITDLIVRFTPSLSGDVLGECFNYHGQETNVILMDATDWEWESDEYRRVVLFHELGHCVLNREHDTTGRIRDGYCTATSIMYPSIDDVNMYVANWNDYMLELFTGATNTQPCLYNGYWGGS